MARAFNGCEQGQGVTAVCQIIHPNDAPAFNPLPPTSAASRIDPSNSEWLIVVNEPTSAPHLRFLRQQPIRRLEILPGMGDELRIAWMIDGFDSDDDVRQLGIVLVNVLDQFVLCIGGSGNENRTGVGN
jgi:hypothetical protein